MRQKSLPPVFFLLLIIIIASVILSGCASPLNSSPKTQTYGPSGKTIFESKEKKTFLEKISPAPGGFYDLEETAGILFDKILSRNWPEALQSLAILTDIWQKNQEVIKNKKAIDEGDAILNKLKTSVNDKKVSESCETLSKFMANAAELCQDYQLSPVSDIISIGNAFRKTIFYVKEENWEKASPNSKETENAWNQSKSALEQVGILGETTKTHFFLNQMKDAIETENKEAFLRHSSSLNESLGKIRNFFYAK